MRTIPAPAAAQLGDRLALTLLVDMLLDTPLYFCSAAVDIEHGLVTYTGVEQLQVDIVRETAGEVEQLQLSLPAVPNEYLSLALGTDIRSKALRLSIGVLHPDTQAVLAAVPLWAGNLDQMPIRYGNQSSGISVTAEHRGVAFSRPKALRYTDADQHRLFPGDRCLEYLIDQSQKQDVWPSAEWFKR